MNMYQIPPIVFIREQFFFGALKRIGENFGRVESGGISTNSRNMVSFLQVSAGGRGLFLQCAVIVILLSLFSLCWVAP